MSIAAPTPVLSTMNLDGSRRWLNPKPAFGRTWRGRTLVGWALIVLFGALPWIEVGEAPAVLIDIPGRRLAFFGLRLAPSDTVALMLGAILIGLVVFLTTALVGRAWCGWACPQTVYLELVFRPLDRAFGKKGVLGKRLPRALGQALRVIVYASLALYLAHTFLAYFVGVDALATWMRRSPFEHPWSFVVMGATTGLMLADFGYFREQLCTVACPYARLQSVLLDRDSLVVGYDRTRGEPRGKLSPKHLPILPNEVAPGDCIDCRACVITCPTGIDVRDGLQLECIACAQCVDACDAIMKRIDKPAGLIRYASQRELEDGTRRRGLRVRPALYAALAVVVSALLAVWLIGRTPAEVIVVRDGVALFELSADGSVNSHLKIRITNLREAAATYHVALMGEGTLDSNELPLTVAAQQRREATFSISSTRPSFDDGTRRITLRVTDEAGMQLDVPYRLAGPSQGAPQ